MLLVLFRHNKTPKVFCLTFGVQVKIDCSRFLFCLDCFVVAVTAEWLVDVSLSEDHKLVAL